MISFPSIKLSSVFNFVSKLLHPLTSLFQKTVKAEPQEKPQPTPYKETSAAILRRQPNPEVAAALYEALGISLPEKAAPLPEKAAPPPSKAAPPPSKDPLMEALEVQDKWEQPQKASTAKLDKQGNCNSLITNLNQVHQQRLGQEKTAQFNLLKNCFQLV